MRGEKTWPRSLAGALGSVLLILGLLVLIIELAGFDPAFYAREYAQNGTAESVGVPEETLNEATEILLTYLQDGRDSLDFGTEVAGSFREYYNEREKLHMEDVKVLNLGAVQFLWVSLILAGVLLVFAFWQKRDRWRIWRACFFGILGVLAAFFAIGIAAAVDFTSFWVAFHHVFFRNDLWTFDPRTSLLIRMFEERFFFDLVGRILLWFLPICFALLLLAAWLWRSGRRREGSYAHSRH